MTRRASWELLVAPSAERALARLPEKAAAAIVEFLVGPLRLDRVRVGHQLRGALAELVVARRGPYRIVYELDEERRRILVLPIDHRADVYRPR